MTRACPVPAAGPAYLMESVCNNILYFTIHFVIIC
nr:MAG TPA: hypothetical protein [Caudoviricetes sp.]